jgi:hypothetical protein
MFYSEDKKIILRVLENYIRTGEIADAQVKVESVPYGKTSFTEKTGEDSRIIMLDEYKVDDKVIWAAYSSRSGTVYLSLLDSKN